MDILEGRNYEMIKNIKHIFILSKFSTFVNKKQIILMIIHFIHSHIILKEPYTSYTQHTQYTYYTQYTSYKPYTSNKTEVVLWLQK